MPRRLGRVEVFAARAVEFDGFLVRQVGEAEGEEGLAVAEDARTPPKVTLFVLFNLRARAGGVRSDQTQEFERTPERDLPSLRAPSR